MKNLKQILSLRFMSRALLTASTITGMLISTHAQALLPEQLQNPNLDSDIGWLQDPPGVIDTSMGIGFDSDGGQAKSNGTSSDNHAIIFQSGLPSGSKLEAFAHFRWTGLDEDFAIGLVGLFNGSSSDSAIAALGCLLDGGSIMCLTTDTFSNPGSSFSNIIVSDPIPLMGADDEEWIRVDLSADYSGTGSITAAFGHFFEDLPTGVEGFVDTTHYGVADSPIVGSLGALFSLSLLGLGVLGYRRGLFKLKRDRHTT